MNYSMPENLGIIACPGGEQFAERVLKQLRGIYRRRFDRKAAALAKRYGISREEAAKQINFQDDLLSTTTSIPNSIDKFRPPELKLEVDFTCFPNGEFKAQILSPVRGRDIYIIQDVENRLPCSFNGGALQRVCSVNDHIFNVLTTADAALQAGASRVSLVLPVYPYSRQHKKKGREGLTASRFGQIMEFVGVSRIITLDIHSREIENCFNKLRLENLHASYQIIRELSRITDITSPDLVVVSPDTGAVDRNKFFASTMKRPLALLYKERDYSKVTKNANETNITSMKLLGDVRGKTVFMADDMLGTGGTLLKAMKFLKDQGAKDVICAISLPFFSGSAVDDFDKAYSDGLFKRIIGTNAVHHEKLLSKEWYVSTDITCLFAHIIERLHHDLSLSPLLDSRDIIQKLVAQQ